MRDNMHLRGAATGLGLALAAAAAPGDPSVPVPPPRIEPADFHVDAVRGSDANDGRSGRPFRTIGRAVEAMTEPGAVCTIHAGIYRESVRFTHSGAAGRPLRFQAEPGAVLSGADPVGGWMPSADGPDSAGARAPGLYAATVGDNPLRKGGRMAVFLGDRMLPEARWPNADGAYPWPTYAFCSAAGYDRDGRNGWIEDTDLPDRPDDYWKGCRLIVLAGHGWQGRDLGIRRYLADGKRIVTDFADDKPGAKGNATLRGPLPRNAATGRGPYAGNEYFLVADPADLADPAGWIRNECDAPGEWAYLFDRADPARSRLYVKTAGGAPTGVEMRSRDIGLDFGDVAHVQVTGLRLFGCRPVFGAQSSNVLLQGLAMTWVDHQRAPGGEGIFIDGDAHAIRDCAIEWSAGNLVTFRSGRGHRFVNNLARGANYSTSRGGLLLWRGARDVLVSHCTLRDSGAMILAMHDAEGAIVEYCEIADGAKLCTDLGLKYDSFIGTYCLRYNLWHGADSAKHSGHGSSAIYLEDGGAQAIVHHNIVWDVDYGIQLNSSSTQHRMVHNTVGPCREAAVLCGSNRQKMAVERFTSVLADNILAGEPLRSRGIGLRGLVLRNNVMGGDPGFIDAARGDFRLRADSPARDAATSVEGLDAAVPDGRPDLGALERGAPDWTREVGHDFAHPRDAVYRYPVPDYRTYTENYSFEAPAGKTAAPEGWRLSGTATRVTGRFHDAANILNDVTARNGRFTIRLAGGPGEARQTVNGLKPGTEYIAAAGFRPGLENRAMLLGVEGYGGDRRTREILLPLPPGFLEAQHGGGHWTMGALRFTTGPTNTTAEVFAGAAAPAAEPVFVDTVLVVPAEPWHNPPHAPVTIDPAAARPARRSAGSQGQYSFTVASNAAPGEAAGARELHLSGDAWSVVPFEYLFTPFTMLEFDLKRSGVPATTGIGIGADGTVHRAAVFLAGPPSRPAAGGRPPTEGSAWTPLHADAEGWEHYRIPVGLYLRYLRDHGVASCLVFLNESVDGAPSGCRFRKVTICEAP